MVNKLKDIKKALDAGAYLSALALSLTIPDVLGNIAYPELSGSYNVGKRYKKWITEYVEYNFESIDPDEDYHYLNADMLYQLRCSFLHDGNYELTKCTYVTEFRLHINSEPHQGYLTSYKMGNDNLPSTVDIDVKFICSSLCWSAWQYYDAKTDKSIFDVVTSPIKILEV